MIPNGAGKLVLIVNVFIGIQAASLPESRLPEPSAREDGDNFLSGHVSADLGRKWNASLIASDNHLCDSARNCDATTECCGAVFGVQLCKPRPLAGQPCDPYAAEECSTPFCECPCYEGYVCQQARDSLYICQAVEEYGNSFEEDAALEADILPENHSA